MKITEYSEVTELSPDNVLIVDGGESGTAKIFAENAGYALVDMTNVNNRRQIFRGKYLGTEITAEQRDNIENGSFKDLWLGDYWTIGGHDWRIVDFDYWYGASGYTGTLQKHHIVLMPDNTICKCSGKMITSDTTTTAHLTTNTGTTYCLALITSMFPEGHVANYFMTRKSSWITSAEMKRSMTKSDVKAGYYSTNAASGDESLIPQLSVSTSSAKSYRDLQIDIPTEFMIFGTRVAAPFNSGAYGQSLSSVEVGYGQLALFRVAPQFIQGNYSLKDLVNAPYTYTRYGLSTTVTVGNYTNSVVSGMTVGSAVGGNIRPVIAYGR